MARFLTEAAFRDAAKAGGAGDDGVRKFYAAETKAIDLEARTVTFVASTDAIDRVGDSVKQDGWQLDRFRKNPVILFAHDYDEPPVGRAVACYVEAGQLLVTVQFAPAEVYDFADTIFRLVTGGYLNAVSVGFIPKKWVWVDDASRPFGLDILEAELLEVSVVPVPAHQDALVQARSKGIDLTGFQRRMAKAGRVLSHENESSLRQARDLLDAVLSQVQPADDATKQAPTPADPETPPADPPTSTDDPAARTAGRSRARMSRELAVLRLRGAA